MREAARTQLSTTQMPTRKAEEWRFTDLSRMVSQTMTQPAGVSDEDACAAAARCALSEADASRVVIVDGLYSEALSDVSGLPSSGVYVGGLADAPAELRGSLGAMSQAKGGVFSTLNSALATSCTCVCVSAGVRLEAPLHVVYVSSGTAGASELAASWARMLVSVGEGAHLEVIEESVAAHTSQV